MKEIFLVHDDSEGRTSRTDFLEIAGYQVTSMQRAEHCLTLLESRKPAIVLVDVLIHGMTGFELCSRIRESFGAEELPIILCSGLYRARAFQDEALTSGAQRYLMMPTLLDELLGHVSLLTGGGGDAQEESETAAA